MQVGRAEATGVVGTWTAAAAGACGSAALAQNSSTESPAQVYYMHFASSAPPPFPPSVFLKLLPSA